MSTTDPASAREEAERLVAMLLAGARLAAAAPGVSGPWGPLGGILSGVLGHTRGGMDGGARGAETAGATSGGGGFATGLPECCVCPVCRGIAALRDPSPEFAERLATGAGDLAAGVASLLRAFAPTEPPTAATVGTDVGSDGATAETPAGNHVWREATRTGHDSQPVPEQDVWSAATRGEGAADPGAVVPPADAAGPDAPRPSAGRPVVPASRAPGEGGEDAPGDGA